MEPATFSQLSTMAKEVATDEKTGGKKKREKEKQKEDQIFFLLFSDFFERKQYLFISVFVVVIHLSGNDTP